MEDCVQLLMLEIDFVREEPFNVFNRFILVIYIYQRSILLHSFLPILVGTTTGWGTTEYDMFNFMWEPVYEFAY